MPEPFYSQRRLTRFLLLVALLISTAASALYLARPSFVISTENRTTDLVMAAAKGSKPAATIVIVDMDEKSLSRYGQWPWPRSLLARLLARIEAAGASAVALDVILAEPDRTPVSSQGVSGGRGHELRTSAPPFVPLSEDQKLAATLAESHTVLGYEFLFDGEMPPSASCRPHPPSVVRITSPRAPEEEPLFFAARGVVCNLSIFNDAVTHSGFLNATPDPDGILRRVPMLIRFGQNLYPSLELATLMQYQKTSQINIVRRGSGMTLKVGDRTIPVDAAGNMILRFPPGNAAVPRVSAAGILGEELPSATLRNKIVLVGSTAAGLESRYQTFAGTIRSHVVIHALVLDNLLTGRHVVRTDDFPVWEALAAGVLAAVTALAVTWTGIAASAAVSLALLAGTWIGMWVLFEARGYLLSPLLPTCLVLFNYVALTIAKGWKLQGIARRVADGALALLQESEKNLASIVSAVPDIIYSLDRSCRVRFVSPAVARFGVAPEALLGRRLLPYISEGDRTPFLRAAADTFQGREGNLEFQTARLKGRKVWLDTHMVPFRDDAGAIVAVLGIARDITDRKVAEQSLAEKQLQLEELNASLGERVSRAIVDIRQRDQILILQGRQAAMGEMISNIAHQWRQPLNTLGLVVQELLFTYGHEDFNRNSMEQTVEKAMELIMHMSKTIDDFRDFFRQEKEVTLFDVRECVERTLSLIEPTLKSMGIEVRLGVNEACEIRGYPSVYSQVLLNILLNSRDAFETSGMGSGLRIDITISRESGRCVVTIADNAGGIPQELLPKVFDPYFTTKGPDKGTGIGLYMAKTIIEKSMGGRLTARNSARGAEFRIEV